MKTTLLTPETDENAVKTAAELIRAGEVVGMPTETVYGLAANALNGEAVKKIFLAKGRPQDNPLITHVACVEEIPPLVRAIPAAARKLMEAAKRGARMPETDAARDIERVRAERQAFEALMGYNAETAYGMQKEG